jgi:hypothetical protein
MGGRFFSQKNLNLFLESHLLDLKKDGKQGYSKLINNIKTRINMNIFILLETIVQKTGLI